MHEYVACVLVCIVYNVHVRTGGAHRKYFTIVREGRVIPEVAPRPPCSI